MREEEGELFLQSEASSLVTVEHPLLDVIIIIIVMVCNHLLKPHSAGPLIQSSPTRYNSKKKRTIRQKKDTPATTKKEMFQGKSVLKLIKTIAMCSSYVFDVRRPPPKKKNETKRK